MSHLVDGYVGYMSEKCNDSFVKLGHIFWINFIVAA